MAACALLLQRLACQWAPALAALLCACSASPRSTGAPPQVTAERSAHDVTPDRMEFADAPTPRRATSRLARPSLGHAQVDPNKISVELTITQTLYAAPTSAALCTVVIRSEVGVFNCFSLLTGLGAWGIAAGSRGMEPGQVQLMESVGPWLVASGARLLAARDHSGRDVGPAVMLGGYLVGPLLGGLASLRHPDSASVAVANSAGIWTAAALELSRIGWSAQRTATFAVRERNDMAAAVGTLIGVGVAMVGGSLLGSELQPSRGQVWAMDGFAAGGLALGTYLTAGRGASDRSTARAGLVGMVLGGALGLWVVPDWDGSLLGALRPHVGTAPDGTPTFALATTW